MRSWRFHNKTRQRAAMAVVVGLVFGAVPCLAQVDATPQPAGLRAFAVRYADGRDIFIPIASHTIRFWTPLFPLIPGASTDRDGLPLSALDFDGTVTGDVVVVRVSLIYGSPHQKQLPVATVRLRADAPIRVEDLQTFGVAPLSLSVVALPPAATNVPSVTCVSTALDVRVEPVAPELRAYQVTVRNNSTRSLVAFEVQAYNGDRVSLSGRQKKPRQESLLPPGGRYQFELRAGAAAGRQSNVNPAWRTLDRIVVTSVVWDDGMIEGDPVPAARERAAAAGNARQLRHVVALFTEARTTHSTLLDVTRRLDALTLDVDESEIADLIAAVGDARLLPATTARQLLQIGMQAVKDGAQQDIAACVKQTGESGSVGACLDQLLGDYQRWLERAGQWASYGRATR